MKTYSLSPERIEHLRQRLVRRGMVVAVLLVVCLVVLIWWLLPRDSISTVVTIISSIACLVGAAIGVRSATSRGQEIWQSIRVEMSDDFVARSQIRIPQIRINRMDVTAVEEGWFGLLVRTSDRSRSLILPRQLDDADFQEIRNRLASWRPIQPRSVWAQLRNYLVSVILLIAFGMLFFSRSLWLVCLAGLGLTGSYGYFYWMIRKAEGIDPRVRRRFIWFTIFPFIVTVFKILILINGIDLFALFKPR